MSELRHHDGAAVRADAGLRARLAAVYADAFGAPPYNGTQQQARGWADEPLVRHAGHPGFRLTTAEEDGEVLGFTYVVRGEETQWFTQTVRERVPPEVATVWLGGHGELVELAVIGQARGRGLGGRLHDDALEGLRAAGARTALLVVDAEAAPARALYASRGWLDLAELVPGSMLMGLALQ